MADSTEDLSTDTGSSSGGANSDEEYYSDRHLNSSVSRNTKRGPSGSDKPRNFDNSDSFGNSDTPGKTGKLGNLSNRYQYNPAGVTPSQVPRTVLGPPPEILHATLMYTSRPDDPWRGYQASPVTVKPYEARASEKLDEFESQFTYGSGDYVHTSPEGYLRSWERANPQSYEEEFEDKSYPDDNTVSSDQSQDYSDHRNESDVSSEDSEEQNAKGKTKDR